MGRVYERRMKKLTRGSLTRTSMTLFNFSHLLFVCYDVVFITQSKISKGRWAEFIVRNVSTPLLSLCTLVRKYNRVPFYCV